MIYELDPISVMSPGLRGSVSRIGAFSLSWRRFVSALSQSMCKTSDKGESSHLLRGRVQHSAELCSFGSEA